MENPQKEFLEKSRKDFLEKFQNKILVVVQTYEENSLENFWNFRENILMIFREFLGRSIW